MKILRIIASMDPAQGGPTEGLLISAAYHRGWGHQTEIVTLDAPGAPYVQNCPFPVHAVGPGIRRDRYTPHLDPMIETIAPDFDAAVIHGLWNHASRGAGPALNRTGLPYVVFTHGMLDPWFRTKYPLKHLAKQLYWWGGQGRILSEAARVLFTTEEEKRLARNMFVGYNSYEGQVVAYGSNVPSITERTEGKSAFAAACPLPESAPYLLFLSRIHEKKGVDLLIEALPELFNSNINLHLVVAGPDQEGLTAKFAMRAAAMGYAERVHFPGILTGAAKWGAFLGAEAFILPSHSENFGIVVAEALGCGTPVLITDKVNIWREVFAAGAGLVANDNVSGVRDLLAQWVSMTEQDRQKMCAAAKACYQIHFAPESAAKDLLDVLTTISRDQHAKK